MNKLLIAAGLLASAASFSLGQDRDTKVRNDREAIAAAGGWIYDDIGEGLRAAKAANRPLMVVFRCIPCEACHEFDEDVAGRDPIVRDLMDQFVCVRIVQMNNADLTRFQHDFDQSFAIALMNPDGTLYGRFGTRSNRDDESKDISLQGLRLALLEALRMHDDYEATRPALAGKQVRSARFKTPLEYPSLAGRYEPTLNYAGAVAKSCVHCHQIGEAERRYFRDLDRPIPDEVLFPYPNPTVLGLTMDPEQVATVARVERDSIGARAGFRPGDRIVALGGQPPLSIADLQWVLRHAPDRGTLDAEVVRDAEPRPRTLTLALDEGWRRRGDLSWRATTWDLRRMALGGMELEPVPAEQRAKLGVSEDRMALRVKHVGLYGEHAVAMRAGVKVGDVVVAFDGRDDLASETETIAHAVQAKRRGEKVAVRLLRDGRSVSVDITLQ
jgi:hypothetical protein